MSTPSTPEAFNDELAVLRLSIDRMTTAELNNRCSALEYVAAKTLSRAGQDEIEALRENAYLLLACMRGKAKRWRRGGLFFAMAGVFFGALVPLSDSLGPGPIAPKYILALIGALVGWIGLATMYEAQEWTADLVPLIDGIFKKVDERAKDVDAMRRSHAYREAESTGLRVDATNAVAPGETAERAASQAADKREAR
jgi:hypothetical protein